VRFLFWQIEGHDGPARILRFRRCRDCFVGSMQSRIVRDTAVSLAGSDTPRIYLAACPQTLEDIVGLMRETGLRIG
jgi:hypothetical protein